MLLAVVLEVQTFSRDAVKSALTIACVAVLLTLPGCKGGGSNKSNDDPGPIFVAIGGVDEVGCGLTWEDACASPQTGTDEAVAQGLDVVFLGQGTYRASVANDSVLVMDDGVSVYGGFAGTESTLAQRGDPSVTPTILDGDVNANDPGTTSDNSNHVVVGASDATLDGVTIRAGRANAPDAYGAGMVGETLTNVTISNVEFLSNEVNGSTSARGAGLYTDDVVPLSLNDVRFAFNMLQASSSASGAGLYTVDSDPALDDVVFDSNEIDAAQARGAGFFARDSVVDVTVTDSNFDSNELSATSSARGAGLAVQGSSAPVTVTNTVFQDNNADGSSSGLGGAIYVLGADSPVTVTDSTFNDNDASASFGGQGGGVYVSGTSSPLTVTNSSFSDNEAGGYSGYGGAISVRGTSAPLTVTGSTFHRNQVSGSSSSGIARGGAIYSNGQSTITVTDSTFRDNSASGSSNGGQGGAIASSNGLTITGVHFIENSARGSYSADGGAIYQSGDALTINDSTFRENSALTGSSSSSASGGAIKAIGAGLTLTNVDFVSNRVEGSSSGISGDASALYLSGATASLDMTNVSFIDNEGGPVIDGINAAATLTASNTLFFGNDTPDFGSASGTFDHTCADENPNLDWGQASTNYTALAGDPTVSVDSGERFLTAANPCLNTGDDTAADAAFAPDDWADYAVFADGTLDAGTVDHGRHHDVQLNPWIVTLDDDLTTITWDVNAPAGTVCVLSEGGTTYDLTPAELAAETFTRTTVAIERATMTCVANGVEVVALAGP